MNALLDEFEALANTVPADGRSLFESSAELNAFWFRNRLPECDAHDTINGIDSEGEEYFKLGPKNLYSDVDREGFFRAYSPLYFDAITQLREVLRTQAK